MSRPRVFQVPPGLRVRGMIPGATQPAMVNAPVRVRQHFGGTGNSVPGPNGAPGSPIWPYDEGLQFNPQDGSVAGGSLQLPPAIGAPPAQNTSPWVNRMTYATVPLGDSNVTGAALTQFPQLSGNNMRASLIIQNQSTATAPDLVPPMYIGFNTVPQVGGALYLPSGLGFYWSLADMPPMDSIFVITGGAFGATSHIFGCIVQGTYIPP